MPRPVLARRPRAAARAAAATFQVGDAPDAVRPGRRGRTPARAGARRALPRAPRRRSGAGTTILDPVRPRRRRRARADPAAAGDRRRALAPGARGRARTAAAWSSSRASRARSMHFALLLGYGAAAVNPYLALRRCAALHAAGDARRRTLERGPASATSRPSARACSRSARRWASRPSRATAAPQIFEAVGPRAPRSSPATSPAPSRGSAASSCATSPTSAAERHGAPRAAPFAGEPEHRPRRRVPLPPAAASATPGTRTRSCRLQRAVRDDSRTRLPRPTPRRSTGPPRRARRCAACSSSQPAGQPLPLERGRAVGAIVRRFATGAMSLGSISPGGARDAGHRHEPDRRRARTRARAARTRAARRPTRTATCAARRSSRSPRRASA